MTLPFLSNKTRDDSGHLSDKFNRMRSLLFSSITYRRGLCTLQAISWACEGPAFQVGGSAITRLIFFSSLEAHTLATFQLFLA